MFKSKKLLFSLGILLLAFSHFVFADESITITTYYPSPYGSYNQLYVADKLGIGTTNPGYKLDVNGNIGTNYSSLVLNPNGGTVGTDGTYGIYWHQTAGTPSPGYGIYRSSGAWSTPYQQLTLSFATGIVMNPGTGYPKCYVDIQGDGLRVTTGNVGIGTTSPIGKLTIFDQSNPGGTAISTGWDAANYYTIGRNNYGGGQLEFNAATNGSGLKAFAFLNGNVGIGTTSPKQTLDVKGSINMSGSVWKYLWIESDHVRINKLSGTQSFYFSKSTTGYDGTGLVELMTITDAGNVGIGTTVPTQRLDVVGNSVVSGTSEGTYLGLFKELGSLPGYAGSRYPTVKTDFTYMYFSVGGVYSSHINSAGTYTAVSDRAKKENFVQVNPQQILAKIDSMPMYQWNFKNEAPSVKHIAPVAQDFYAAFGLNGNDDKMISHIDPAGVAIVGVKALSQKAKTQQQQIDKLQQGMEDMRRELRSLTEKS